MMMADPVKWGLVTTIKADVIDILSYVAYHIELGAHRLYIYLDEPNPAAYDRLKAHPKVRVITCDEIWWRKRFSKRPEKHQVRQTMNATHAYHRRPEVDWLIHMDVDEFIAPDIALESQLAALPAAQKVAVIRPAEVLAGGDGTAFKACPPSKGKRDHIMQALYPTFGAHLKAGFLSHLTGKVFARTGMPDAELRIHHLYLEGERIMNDAELTQSTLCHLHTTSWEHWRDSFNYRIKSGSYRSELTSNRAHELGMTLHELLSLLHDEEGETGLRAFFDEVCADSPDLRKRLAAQGLLKTHNLDLEGARTRVFPP